MIPAFRSTCVAALIALTVWAGAAQASSLDPLAGQWRGVEAQGASISASDLDMRIVPREKGFDLAWTEPGMPGSKETKVQFFATDRPGVFVETRGGNWLFSMFGSDRPVDPLEGETLRWARVEGDALIVYRLDVAEDGGYRLDRYAWDSAGGVLEFAFERRSHDADPMKATGRLVRAGGDE